MKILITGGRGFIARNLSEHLGDRHAVTCLGRDGLDLLDSEAVAACLATGRFDAVIHSATYDAAPQHSTKDPAKVLENNLRMFFNLARCHGQYGRMLYFGSGAEFGRDHWKPRMAEDDFDRHVPTDPYGFSKYLMTRHALATGDNVFNLRLFGVFGKYDDWRTRFLANACARAVRNMPIVMKQDRIFDHLWIGDLARIVEWFLAAEPRERVYNICSGTTYRFSELARMVQEAAGKQLPIVVKQAGMGPEYSGDNSRFVAASGGFKFTPMKDAIACLYGWHASNRHLWEHHETGKTGAME